MDLKKSMLGVFAHPDDETFLPGGLFALAHMMGAPTALMCLTRGEKGKGNLTKPMDERELAETRSYELKEAAKILGVSRVFIFDYPDGGLSLVPQDEILEKIVTIIKEIKPYRILTFGPEGGTGHRDHIALHGVVNQAFQSTQNLKEPPRELYWRAFPESMRKLYLKPPHGRPRTEAYYHKGDFPVTYKDRDIESIDITSVLEVKKQASLVHKTQNSEWLFKQSPELIHEIWEREYYYRAQ